MKKPLIAVMMFVLLLVPTGASALSSFRCGTKLVQRGDTRARVLHRCGEPDDKFIKSVDRVRVRGWRGFVERESLIEEWLYNRGSKRFLYRLFFKGGVLVDIRTDDYGW